MFARMLTFVQFPMIMASITLPGLCAGQTPNGECRRGVFRTGCFVPFSLDNSVTGGAAMRKCSGHKRDRQGFFANVLRGLFSGDTPGRSGAGRRKRTGPTARRLRFERCEDRQLLAAVGVVFNDL